MKTSIVVLLVAAGCGSNVGGVATVALDQGTDGGAVADAGTPQPDGGSDAGSPPASDAGVPAPTSHWVRDFALPNYGAPLVLFHSPAPGDLWLENESSGHEWLYHRVNREWVSVFAGAKAAVAWVRSPSEAWILEGDTIHIVGLVGNRDLVLPPGRFYSTIGDGWISYFQLGQTLPANCPSATNNPGVVGFLRVTDSGLVDMPMPNLCQSSLPDTIYMGTGVSVLGDVLSWNGSTWEVTAQFHGSDSIFSQDVFGFFSGSAPDDLYVWGPRSAFHFDGTAWKYFEFTHLTGVDSVWVRPWGPRWGASKGDAFEFQDGGWQDRGPLPILIAHSQVTPNSIGSDGTDVFITGEDVEPPPVGWPSGVWIYRYLP